MNRRSQHGPANPVWKGGRTITAAGYVLVKLVGHPMADARGYVYEHRLIGSQIVGRILKPEEIVHHKNHKKADNRPENLEVVPSIADHRFHHRKRRNSGLRMPREENPIIRCSCACGTEFPKFDSFGRPRRFVLGHNASANAGERA